MSQPASQPASRPASRHGIATKRSLVAMGALGRLALASGAIALLWLAVAWALH